MTQSQKQPGLAAGRRKARHFAMQGLYQWQLNKTAPNEIEAQFRVDFNMKGTDLEYFRELLTKVLAHLDEIDDAIRPLTTERTIDELDPVTLSLLRIGIYEFQQRIDVPYKVVINEAVNLAKKFGPEDSSKFVNAVLDKAALQLRTIETAAENKN